MAVWLKMIGTTENPCRERYDRESVDFTKEPRELHKDDQLVLYAVGSGTLVFAIARVTSEPHASREERFPFRVDIEYSVNLPVQSGVSVREISDRNIVGAVQWGSSYLELRQEEFDRAVALLQEAAVTA